MRYIWMNTKRHMGCTWQLVREGYFPDSLPYINLAYLHAHSSLLFFFCLGCSETKMSESVLVLYPVILSTLLLCHKVLNTSHVLTVSDK